jgi:hypothetical protein
MKKINFPLPLRCQILFLSLLGLLSLPLQAQTLKYTYDALGRVTFVEDATNGNRDYDYDKAGNRLLVSSGTASDAAAEPAPPMTPAQACASSGKIGVIASSWTNGTSSEAAGRAAFTFCAPCRYYASSNTFICSAI